MKLPMQVNLKDKVAVVTGAGGVICSVMAEALAMSGAKVALLDLNEEAAQKSAEAIVAKGFVAKGYKCNVLEKESIEAARDAIAADFGTCDILVNGAGGNNPKASTDDEYFKPEDLGEMKTFFDLDPQGVSFVFSLNFMGTLLPTQVFAKDMVNKEGANIINIASMNAYTPLTKIPAYSGAKAAIVNFTEWLAVHFSKVGIRCNAIAPGFLSTNQNKALLFNEDGTPTARTGKILAGTPMERFGEPEELVGALLFLASSEASGFVSGACIPVDGAFAAYAGV
jgi:NAD(P)-dependent dehydrogenase (short-subunit alcohol dehydrogenase family)